jgi:hypothetical protein
MATIEEETAKRYALAKRLNPWMAIDYLEQQLSAKDEEIARLLHEIERLRKSYSIESGND